MDKKISQMTREEKLQVLADYHACKRERHIILRYVQALRREDAEQTAYFEGFGESVHQIVLNGIPMSAGLFSAMWTSSSTNTVG